MILFSVIRQHQEECLREDNNVEDGSQTSSCSPPLGCDSVELGDDHAGKIIHSVRVRCTIFRKLIVVECLCEEKIAAGLY